MKHVPGERNGKNEKMGDIRVISYLGKLIEFL